jgi:3-isopropylmalate/(R)-2-methylmalate dehydratase small subunit
MRGTAHTFGDEINTDVIAPSDYFGEPIETMAEHVFEPERPGFAAEIEEGDLVVAGEHFGSGSSRESAPMAIQAAGVGAVIAESFARIYYRNSVTIGLPALTVAEATDRISEGDELRIELEEATVINETTGEELAFEPLPEEIRRIFDAGGIVEHYRENPGGLRIEDRTESNRN